MVNLPTLFDASTVAPVTPDFMSTDGLSSEADHLAATRCRFVPADMRAAPCWMVARIVAGDNGKALKVPHRVTRGAGGGVSVLALVKGEGHNDPATHCTFADAMEAIVADPALELGFALGTGNDFACVDLDDLDKVAPEHRDGATEQHRLIREGLTPLTYSEISRSGKGWHFIGRWPEAPPDLNRKKHAKFEAELLVRQFLVVTGDHRADVQGATTEVAEIGDKFDGVYRWILAGDGPATGVATLPADGIITPGRVTDAKQLRLILSAGKNGEAFRDGRRAKDWSTTFKAILNATAQFRRINVSGQASKSWRVLTLPKAPLRRAALTASLLQEVETALRDVYRDAPLGSQVAHMPEGSADDMATMRATLRGRRGSTLLIEGIAASVAAGMAPNLGKFPDDLTPDLGKARPGEMIEAARGAICMAFGVLPGMFNPSTTGPLVREGQRHLAGWVLQPIAELVAEEASAKLGGKVMIDVGRPLQAFDSGGRARALSQLIEAMGRAKELGLSPAEIGAAFKSVNWGGGDELA